MQIINMIKAQDSPHNLSSQQLIIRILALLKFELLYSPYIFGHFNPKLNELPPHYILEESNFDFRYVRLCDLDIPRKKIVDLFANSGDPDQTSDLGLPCLPITLLGVSRLQRVIG